MGSPAGAPSAATGGESRESAPSAAPSIAIDNETVPSDVEIVGANAPGDSDGTPAFEGPSNSNGAGGSAGSGDVGAAGSGEPSGVGGAAPETADEPRIVLFDGTNLDAWVSRNGGGPVGWQVVGDGAMVVTPGSGDIITRQRFEDVFVHAEYKTPALPANVTGQDRGNSGIYVMGMYEVQVLDSFGREPEIDGCGAIYEVRAPLTVACFREEIWNTYEIDFQAPRYDEQGNKLSNARMLLVTLNGVVVQQDVEVPGATRAGNAEAPGPAGLMLQEHGNRVSFRNIWVIPR
jgi:hypothetical protein